MGLNLFAVKKRCQNYDITIFQTPKYGEIKGYEQVYRMNIEAAGHEEALHHVFCIFNVSDRKPRDYDARFILTGDIVLIDEVKRGQTYYKLLSGGWTKVNRVHVR